VTEYSLRVGEFILTKGPDYFWFAQQENFDKYAASDHGRPGIGDHNDDMVSDYKGKFYRKGTKDIISIAEANRL
jgi:hypothetical protein